MGVLALLGIAALPFAMLLQVLSTFLPMEIAIKIVGLFLAVPFSLLGLA